MEIEKTNNLENELMTENGTFVDSVIDSLEIPGMTEKEADEYKEQEVMDTVQEGGL